MRRTQSLFYLLQALREHTVEQDIRDSAPHGLITRGGRQEVLSQALVEGHGVQLVSGNLPPPGQDGARQNCRRQIRPDQRLGVFRNEEVLFHLCEHVGQVCQRPGQIGPAARRPSPAEHARCLPGFFSRCGHPPGKIMGTNEERTAVEDLSARRLVVGIIQTDQGVAQERSEQPASFIQLARRIGCLNLLGQIGARLQGGMRVIDESGGPFASFSAGENGQGHLELPELSRETNQRLRSSPPLRHFIHAGTQLQQCFQRDQTLRIQYSMDSFG